VAAKGASACREAARKSRQKRKYFMESEAFLKEAFCRQNDLNQHEEII
jgi:hypothetical protein